MSPMKPAVAYYRKSVGNDHEVEVFIVTRYARTHGYSVRDSYVDDDISGQRRDRPEFTRLIDDIASDALKGHTILVRDQERLSRGSLADLEEWHVQTSLADVTTISCEDGRVIVDDEITGMKAVMARAQARRTSKLVSNRKMTNAALGKPPRGRNRPFGYTLGWKSIIEEEAAILREAAERLLAGETFYGIACDFLARGITTYRGKPLTTPLLSAMLRKPERAALRAYKGKIVAKGAWPAIFSEEEYYRIQARLAQNKGRGGKGRGRTPRRHLLTGILVCGCGAKLGVSSKKHKGKQYRYYRCPGAERGGCGRVTRSMKAVDEYVIGKAYLALKEYLPQVAERPVEDDTERLVAACEEKMREARRAYNEDVIGLADWIDVRDVQTDKIKELRKLQQVKKLPMPIDTAEALISDETTVDKKRSTIARLWPVIEVRQAAHKGERFHPDQLRFPNN